MLDLSTLAPGSLCRAYENLRARKLAEQRRTLVATLQAIAFDKSERARKERNRQRAIAEGIHRTTVAGPTPDYLALSFIRNLDPWLRGIPKDALHDDPEYVARIAQLQAERNGKVLLRFATQLRNENTVPSLSDLIPLWIEYVTTRELVERWADLCDDDRYFRLRQIAPRIPLSLDREKWHEARAFAALDTEAQSLRENAESFSVSLDAASLDLAKEQVLCGALTSVIVTYRNRQTWRIGNFHVKEDRLFNEPIGASFGLDEVDWYDSLLFFRREVQKAAVGLLSPEGQTDLSAAGRVEYHSDIGPREAQDSLQTLLHQESIFRFVALLETRLSNRPRDLAVLDALRDDLSAKDLAAKIGITTNNAHQSISRVRTAARALIADLQVEGWALADLW